MQWVEELLSRIVIGTILVLLAISAIAIASSARRRRKMQPKWEPGFDTLTDSQEKVAEHEKMTKERTEASTGTVFVVTQDITIVHTDETIL
jgi:hypothetical protein